MLLESQLPLPISCAPPSPTSLLACQQALLPQRANAKEKTLSSTRTPQRDQSLLLLGAAHQWVCISPACARTHDVWGIPRTSRLHLVQEPPASDAFCDKRAIHDAPSRCDCRIDSLSSAHLCSTCQWRTLITQGDVCLYTRTTNKIRFISDNRQCSPNLRFSIQCSAHTHLPAAHL